MKKEIKVDTVYAMTWNGMNGNPAGVVLDALGLSPEERQQIAARVGHSETAFLERKSSGEYKIEFYTPIRKIPYCGHATIATFSLFRMLHKEVGPSLKVEMAGKQVTIHFEGERVLMEQNKPIYEELSGTEESEALSSLGLTKKDLDPIFVPKVVDTGNRFVLIAVNSREGLSKLIPQQDKIKAFSEKKDLVGLYVFLHTQGDHQATTRMFAPRYGINEESATGMAAGPLACVLVEFYGHVEKQIRILQGDFMTPSQPSEIIAYPQIQNSKIGSLKVGGTATKRP